MNLTPAGCPVPRSRCSCRCRRGVVTHVTADGLTVARRGHRGRPPAGPAAALPAPARLRGGPRGGLNAHEVRVPAWPGLRGRPERTRRCRSPGGRLGVRDDGGWRTCCEV